MRFAILSSSRTRWMPMRSHSSPRWLCLNHEPHRARIRSRPRLRPEELSWWRRMIADDARRCESGVWHASLSARRQRSGTARGSAATDGFGWHYGLMAGLHVSKGADGAVPQWAAWLRMARSELEDIGGHFALPKTGAVPRHSEDCGHRDRVSGSLWLHSLGSGCDGGWSAAGIH